MDFSQAVQTCLRKYAEFGGRASRSEYWWFVLFTLLVSVLLGFVSGMLSGLFTLAMIVPQIAAATRRLHDTNRSGWWQLVCLVPVIGLVVIIVLLAQQGQPGDNEHGPAPLAATSAAG